MIDRAHSGREPHPQRRVHGRRGIEDDGARNHLRVGVAELALDALVGGAAYFTDTRTPTLWRLAPEGNRIGELEAWTTFADTPIQYDGGNNLYPGGVNATGGVRDTSFVRNLTTGTTTPLNLRPDGQLGNSPATEPEVSADGRFVVFSSLATDLTGDTYPSTRSHIFRRDV